MDNPTYPTGKTPWPWGGNTIKFFSSASIVAYLNSCNELSNIGDSSQPEPDRRWGWREWVYVSRLLIALQWGGAQGWPWKKDD